jgi:hypothetical protein
MLFIIAGSPFLLAEKELKEMPSMVSTHLLQCNKSLSNQLGYDNNFFLSGSCV